MSNRIKKKEETKSSFQESAAFFMGIFALAVLCLLPLVVTNFYFNILETKYLFFCGCAIIMILVMGGFGLVSGRLGQFFKGFDLKKTVRGLSVPDWAILAFWLCNLISFAFADIRWEAFWGTSGRYNGLFLMTIYTVVYFMMTRFFHFRQWYLDAFLAVGVFVCIFGITDYFQMDILGFKRNMLDEQKAIYTSTFGNINTYTVYVGALLVVSTILFAVEKNKNRMLWYYGNIILTSFALIMGTSDNAYLTLAALFGFAPLYLFHTKTGLRRYLIALTTFLTVMVSISWINAANADVVLGIDSAFNLIANMGVFRAMVVVFWVLTAAVAFLTMRKPKTPVKSKELAEREKLGKWAIYGWIGVMVVVAAAIVFVFYDANVAGHADRYAAIRSYVVFNDDWGTERGYIWRRSIELYKNVLNPFQKLFGYGPDMFKILIQTNYEARKLGDTFVVYDAAHNEYLHYLMTVGLFGMVSYIVFMVSSVVKMAKNVKGRPEVAAVMFAVTAYMVQAIVNINLPIAMPIILCLLAMGLTKKETADDQERDKD